MIMGAVPRGVKEVMRFLDREECQGERAGGGKSLRPSAEGDKLRPLKSERCANEMASVFKRAIQSNKG